jgi:SAM-dependent methyltransferase
MRLPPPSVPPPNLDGSTTCGRAEPPSVARGSAQRQVDPMRRAKQPTGKTTPARIASCPVCGEASPRSSIQPDWGSWHTCPDCSLEFAWPRSLPAHPTVLFDAAYRGTEHVSGFDEFAHRVRQREALLARPELWFWTPAFADTIARLKMLLPQGGTVLEIGCGLGFLLHALRREGFDAVGIDVARIAVDLNRADGFNVWHGDLETMPHGWTKPDAVVAFFMLHHLVDPVAMLREVRARWPSAPLIVAQYGPTNVSRFARLAPRNLTHWTARALGRALEEAGYDAIVNDYPSSGSEHPALQRLRSRVFERVIGTPAIYRVSKRVVDRVAGVVARPMRQHSFVLLAFAAPCPPGLAVPAGDDHAK